MMSLTKSVIPFNAHQAEPRPQTIPQQISLHSFVVCAI